MDAIVYTSNTGSTAEYARLLGEKSGLPVYSLKDAAGAVPEGTEIVYMGWLMASHVQGCDTATKRYAVRAVCGVGMSPTGTKTEEVRSASAISEDTPVFTLQGGFDRKKLRGAYRLMMAVMSKSLAKSIADKPSQTPEDRDTLDLLTNGGSRVHPEALNAVLEWLGQAK